VSGPYTLLVVHAHPDDEASSTGGLLRLAANRGHTTVLVTCTNGDLGETKGPAQGLAPRQYPEHRSRLAAIRRQELLAATQVLGVTHLHLLDYHDSGMQGWETNQEARVFAQVDIVEAASQLVRIIRQHCPDVVITYDENGGYGHPDHVMTHRVTRVALAAAADATRWPAAGTPWQVRKIYYTAWARSDMLRAFKIMHFLGRPTPLRNPDFDPNTLGCPDELVTTRVDVRPVMRQKWQALFTHRSQMQRRESFWWFLSLTGRWLYGYESFRCVYRATPLQALETDIFHGLA
jgi:N-acetyl-1-D-myo-inositol-2-amino-2-deoxy-alpha-D-glucopyranoside deacetylase/mycothiol S-conjugate amidase